MIEYPKKYSEAEIQALLWYFLRKKKVNGKRLDARLEVKAQSPLTRRGKGCRFDIVIFVDKVAKCIVECKSWGDGYAKTVAYRRNNTKQIRKYKEVFGLPVYVCGRMSYVVPLVNLIEKDLIH